MSEKEFILLTREGHDKLESELDHLKSIDRREVAARIKEAIAFGDLSENAEYDAAKNEQAKLEEKISKIESTLRKAKVIKDEEISLDVVGVGTTVEIKDIEFDEIIKYTIVGTAEANIAELKLSDESPVGNGLLGKKIGDVVNINVPNGIAKYEILGIQR